MKPSLIIVIFIFIVSLSGKAAMPSLENCAAIEKSAERLACYDKLANRLLSEHKDDKAHSSVNPVASEAGDTIPSPPAETPAVPKIEPMSEAEAVFGLEHKQKLKEKRPGELQLEWTQTKKDAYGRWIITMKNGQVWHQIDSKDFRFRNSKQKVIISRGFSSGFFLKEAEHNKRIRVKRIK